MTLQARCRAETAWIREMSQKEKDTKEMDVIWDEKDMSVLGLSKFGLKIDEIIGKNEPQRVFRAHFEEWEEADVSKNDPAVKQCFSRKHGELKFIDIDAEEEGKDGVINKIDRDDMH